MRYVQRDAEGKLIGHFANPQPGYAEEEVADDHPDILGWNAEREAFRLMDHNTESNERLRTAEARLRLAEENLEVIRAQLANMLAIAPRVEELERKAAEETKE